MKLLVLNPFGTDIFDEAVQAVLDRAKRSDTELAVDHLAKGPPFFRYSYFQSLAVPDIVERILQAEKQAYQGVYVACSAEPGVKEAREVVDIPVVGGAIPAVYLSRQLGQRFGFITDTELARVNTYDLFKTYKLDVECAGIKAVKMRIEEIARDPETNQKRVIEVAQQLVRDGADILVLGCTIVAAFFTRAKIDLPTDLVGIPFLDSNVCSLKTLEMLVDLREKLGVTVSRRAYYAKPQDGEKEAFQRIRKIYGLPSL
ncbi:MAG: aspartate/glutamate racemase family protein [Candidatus Hodarchaeota archaeon]